MSGPGNGDPQFRVGPEPDPDRYVLGAAVSSGAEGILYRGRSPRSLGSGWTSPSKCSSPGSSPE